MHRRTLLSLLIGLSAVAVVAAGLAALDPGGADESATAVSTATTHVVDSTTSTSQRTTTTTTVTSVAPTATTKTTMTTTTTRPATTTTTTKMATTGSGYAHTPKPATGPNEIAPGGALTKHLAEDIAAAFGFPTIDVETAIAAAALPPEADGNPEGWLAPGAYHLAPGATALDLVQAMVDRQVAHLEERGVPREEWHRVLTAASVIEKETYNQNEKPNVARVLTNRLAGGGPLQMDSIILYPGPEDRIFTTSEERASDQPYNSYRHNGLPPTPICSPDEAAIDAVLNPPPGSWWFYVTVDLHTGETRYAVTYEQHLMNVELLRAWLRENPIP